MHGTQESWRIASGEHVAVAETSALARWDDAVQALERWLVARVGGAPARRTSVWTRVGAATAHPNGVMPPGSFVVHRIVLTAPGASRSTAALAPLDLELELDRAEPDARALLLEGYGRVRSRGGHLVVLTEASDAERVCEVRVYVPAPAIAAYAGEVELRS